MKGWVQALLRRLLTGAEQQKRICVEKMSKPETFQRVEERHEALERRIREMQDAIRQKPVA